MERDCRKRKRELGGASYKTKNDGGVVKSAEMAVDQWLYLPSGPLGQIFSKLNLIDVILVIPLVCKYWGQIFLKGLFCRQENSDCLDFSPLFSEPFYSFFCRLRCETVRAKRLMNLIVGAMHAFASGSENDAQNGAARPTSITDIKFCFGLPFYDRHLVYIAERCPELRYIFLPCAENITGKGVSRAMRCWSRMERMHYGPLSDLHLSRSIEEIGVNCKNLQSIVLTSFEFQWQSAELIVRYLRSLKILSLYHAKITKYGLHIFLSRCKRQIELNFNSCFDINNKDVEQQGNVKIWNIQQGRKIKWKTNINSDKMGELYTSKELVDLVWKRKNYMITLPKSRVSGNNLVYF